MPRDYALAAADFFDFAASFGLRLVFFHQGRQEAADATRGRKAERSAPRKRLDAAKKEWPLAGAIPVSTF
jgi:hypothetical protein